MAESSLQDRLRDHAKAFDGLLSLIPAKIYYGEDTSDQWKRKKQTKAQAAEARRNKLDPDSELNRSVKEVLEDEARKKRKRDQMQEGDEDDWSEVDGVEAEKPGQGLKKKTASKKPKVDEEEEEEMTEKEQAKEAKKQARKERKAERQRLREEEAEYERRSIKGVNKIKLGQRQPRSDLDDAQDASGPSEDVMPNASIENDDVDHVEPSDMHDIDVSGLVAAEDPVNDSAGASTPPSEPQSPVFDAHGTPADSTGQAPSTTTSVDSNIPPSEKPKHIKIPTDTTALRARLAARIQALREARKADDKPVRTRQELIESRREKQAEKKARKKELRRQTKAEEDRIREEALASARNSPGSILSPSVDLDNSFAFGRVAFGDGAQLSHDLTHVLNNPKKKGPSDPKSALQKLESAKKRLEEMDEEKRKDVEEKESWLVARRRAEGEKIRDDEKMLKKAVKRKELTKKKSEKAWEERSAGVAKSMRDRQRKREDNIRKRREEKMLGKAGKKKGKGGASKKSKARPGFEGAGFGGSKRK